MTAGAGTVDLDGPNETLRSSLSVNSGSLNLNGTFSASAGTIANVAINDIASPGTLNFGSNNLNATTLLTEDYTVLNETGTITVSGLLSLDGGTISGSGDIDANGGIKMGNPHDYYDGNVVIDGRTLNNASGQAFACGLPLELSDGAVVNNRGTMTFSSAVYGDTDTFSGGIKQLSGAASTFNNSGSLIVSGGTSITVNGVAFNVNGGTVDIDAGGRLILFETGGTSTAARYTVDSGSTLEIGDTPYTFDAQTTLTGAGALTVQDASVSSSGTVLLLGTSTLTGPTNLDYGTLEVDGSQAGSAITSGGIVTGTGTVGAISSDNTLSPGDSPTVTGILTADGDVTLDSGSYFDLALNGPDAGTGYDQLDATGTVSLTGCEISGTLGFTPSAGETFTIIQSTSPIVGTFSQMQSGNLKPIPQGGSVLVGNTMFTIDYAGGPSGDDVVLTPEASTPVPVPTSLAMYTQPPETVNAGSPFGLAVAVDDNSGSIDTAYTGSVSLALASGNGTLSGITTVNAVNGVATFAGLSLSQAGDDTIEATSGQLTPVRSAVYGPGPGREDRPHSHD